jgi:hypothetical protein
VSPTATSGDVFGDVRLAPIPVPPGQSALATEQVNPAVGVEPGDAALAARREGRRLVGACRGDGRCSGRAPVSPELDLAAGGIDDEEFVRERDDAAVGDDWRITVAVSDASVEGLSPRDCHAVRRRARRG